MDSLRQQRDAWVGAVLGRDVASGPPGQTAAPAKALSAEAIHQRIMLCASRVLDQLDFLELPLREVVTDPGPLLRAVTQRIVDLHERIGAAVSEAAEQGNGGKVRAQVAMLEGEAFNDACLAAIRGVAEAAGEDVSIDMELAMMFDDVSTIADRLAA